MNSLFRLAQRFAIVLIAGMLFPIGASAQIRTDSSLGKPAQMLAGPTFVIPETLGKLAGSNLFHSFQTFNIAPGESARFTTTTAGIANVISRVTGGESSNIYGRISLVPLAGSPAFVFINPAGITFGHGASINVPGAFHASTADHVSFADGSRYAADLSRTSSFSTADPASFGFLGQQKSLLMLDSGASLVASAGKSVSLTGGDILISEAGVFADGGDIRLASTGFRAQEVPFSGRLAQGAGMVVIDDGGIVSVTTSASNRTGSICVQAGEFIIEQRVYPNIAGLYGRALGGGGGGANIEIDASESVSLRSGGVIRAETRTGAAGGLISIASPLVSIDNAYISATSYAAGRAGSVQLDAGRIGLSHGGQVIAAAQGTGAAGHVALNASETITISGRDPGGSRSGIVANSSGYAPAGQIDLTAPQIILRDDALVSATASSGTTAATTGHIHVNAVDLLLENGGKISVEGYDSMGRGSVLIEASGSLRIVGKGEERNSSPGSDTVSTGILGHGTEMRIFSPDISISDSGGIRSESWYQTIPGSIFVGTQRLALSSGGHISGSALGHSYTYGIGAPIVIEAGEFVRMEGNSNGRYSTIESGARSSGGSGSVRVTTPWLRIADGASINTNTGRFGTATAGRIDLTVVRLDLLNGGKVTSFEQGHAVAGGQITVSASDSILLDHGYINAAGDNEAGGGRIVINSPSLELRAGRITASNNDESRPGGIQINAGELLLTDTSRIESSSTSTFGAGNIALRIGDTLRVFNSAITTTADSAGGGNITISGADAVLLSRSLITTSVSGENYDGVGGNGGNISLGARSLALDNGFIQANTVARNALGGNIGISVELLVASGNHLLVGGQTPYTFRSNVRGFNVIQAAAPTGVSGAINISSPALDLSGSVLALSADILDLGGLGRSPCQPTGGSSLTQVGRGGFAPSARDVLGPLGPVTSIRPTAASSIDAKGIVQSSAMQTYCSKG